MKADSERKRDERKTYLHAVGDDGVALLERLQGLSVVASPLLAQTQVVYGLHAVCLDLDGTLVALGSL